MKTWIPLGIAVTLLSMMVYGVAQQLLRQLAYDPQIEMVRDYADAFAGGQSTDYIAGDSKIDLRKSLSPFIMAFDTNGNLTASSGELDGQVPTLPNGVLDYAKQHGENKLTWQPKTGVRIAIAVDYYTGQASGYILAGKSLKLSEDRTEKLGLDILAGWIFTMVVTLGATALLQWKDSGSK